MRIVHLVAVLFLGIASFGCGGREGPDEMRPLADWRMSLKHKDPAVRSRAIGEAAQADAATAVPLLAELLNDPDFGTRRLAGQTLASMGDAAVGALAKAAASGDEVARQSAGAALQEIRWPKSADSVPAIQTALKNPDPSLRRWAAQALGRLGPSAQPAVSALIEGLKDGDLRVRIAVAQTLGQIGAGAQGAVPALVEALNDPDPQIRNAALNGLGGIGPLAQAAVPALIERLTDSNELVRNNVPFALGKIGKRVGEVRAVLLAAFKRGENRRNVIVALLRIDPADDAVAAALGEALRDADRLCRVGAAEGLWEIATRVLSQALQDRDPSVRASAQAVVDKVHQKANQGAAQSAPADEAVVRAQLEALRDKDRPSQIRAAEMLWELAIGVLEQTLGDPDPGVRGLAQQALDRMRREKPTQPKAEGRGAP